MPDEWFYIKDKKKLGPVAFAQLRQLTASSQLLVGDMVLQGGTTRWQAANTVAGLFAAPAPDVGIQAAPVAPANPFAAPPDAFAAPDAGAVPFVEAAPEPPPDLEAFAEATSSHRTAPHQGGLILGLGIASIVSGLLGLFGVCGGVLPALYPFLVFSLVAASLGIPVWVKAGTDLRKMKSNLVDPDGAGSTHGGRICGLIGAILGVGGIVVGFTVILIVKSLDILSR